MNNQKSNHSPETLRSEIDRGKKQRSKEPMDTISPVRIDCGFKGLV